MADETTASAPSAGRHIRLAEDPPGEGHAGWRRGPNPTGRNALVAGALIPVIAAGALVAFAAWSDSLGGLAPALARNGAPVGVFVGAVLILVAAGFLLGGVAHGELYVATLWATLPFLPAVASLVIILGYITTDTGQALHHEAVLFGVLIAAAVWVISASPLRGLASADVAQSRSFEELRQRTMAVATLANEDPPASGNARWPDVRGALAADLALLKGELGWAGDPGAGLRYVSASGYINLWRTLHRAEEAVMTLEPEPDLSADAAYDDLRIAGSNMANAGTLGAILHEAVATIDPHAAGGYLPRLATAVPAPSGAAPAGRAAAAPAASDSDRATARAVIVAVRRSINEYRDSRWEGLVRERNRLLRTNLLTSTVVLLLVGLAVARDVGPGAIAAASAYFLIGATIGLFARLRVEGTTATAVDDYGLFEARLLHTPIVSGLAALGGVFLAAALPAAVGTGGAAGQKVDLMAVFDLSKNAAALVTAGIFGLAPELLIGSLHKQVEAMKSDLSSSQGGDSTGADRALPAATRAP